MARHPLQAIPAKTAATLVSSGWSVTKTTARRSIQSSAGPLECCVWSDGDYLVKLGALIIARGTEMHEDISARVCFAAMEANERAWSYRDARLTADRLIDAGIAAQDRGFYGTRA